MVQQSINQPDSEGAFARLLQTFHPRSLLPGLAAVMRARHCLLITPERARVY